MRRLTSVVLLLISDISMLIGSFLLAFWTRTDLLPSLGLLPDGFFNLAHFTRVAYVLLVFVLVFFYERLYHDLSDAFVEFLHLARGLVLSVILISVFIYFSGQYQVFARTILFLMFFWGSLLLPLGRLLTRRILRAAGLSKSRCLLIGQGGALAGFLAGRASLDKRGFDLVGWLGPDGDLPGLDRLGDHEVLTDILTRERIDTVFLVAEGLDDRTLLLLVNRIEPRVPELRIVPKAGPMDGLTTEIEYLDEILIIKTRNNLYSAWNRLVKRVFDLTFSLLLLLVCGLPLLGVALLIRLESPGGALFRQDRFGRQGRTFRLWKFRTMYTDNEDRLERFLADHPDCRREWREYKKIKSRPDPRVTPLGSWLRRFSVDEFPQIWQVFIGQMSLVGPRPYLVREEEEIRDSAAVIFRVKSGLTGLWQIRGRNELSFRERIRLDEYYVRNWSLSLDFYILLKTFMVVIRGKGAY